MPKCLSCGKEVDDVFKFCPFCGGNVDRSEKEGTEKLSEDGFQKNIVDSELDDVTEQDNSEQRISKVNSDETLQSESEQKNDGLTNFDVATNNQVTDEERADAEKTDGEKAEESSDKKLKDELVELEIEVLTPSEVVEESATFSEFIDAWNKNKKDEENSLFKYCKTCNTKNSKIVRFCKNCGGIWFYNTRAEMDKMKNKKFCLNCGAENDTDSMVCCQCGRIETGSESIFGKCYEMFEELKAKKYAQRLDEFLAKINSHSQETVKDIDEIFDNIKVYDDLKEYETQVMFLKIKKEEIIRKENEKRQKQFNSILENQAETIDEIKLTLSKLDDFSDLSDYDKNASLLNEKLKKLEREERERREEEERKRLKKYNEIIEGELESEEEINERIDKLLEFSDFEDYDYQVSKLVDRKEKLHNYNLVFNRELNSENDVDEVLEELQNYSYFSDYDERVEQLNVKKAELKEKRIAEEERIKRETRKSEFDKILTSSTDTVEEVDSVIENLSAYSDVPEYENTINSLRVKRENIIEADRIRKEEELKEQQRQIKEKRKKKIFNFLSTFGVALALIIIFGIASIFVNLPGYIGKTVSKNPILVTAIISCSLITFIVYSSLLLRKKRIIGAIISILCFIIIFGTYVALSALTDYAWLDIMMVMIAVIVLDLTGMTLFILGKSKSGIFAVSAGIITGGIYVIGLLTGFIGNLKFYKDYIVYIIFSVLIIFNLFASFMFVKNKVVCGIISVISGFIAVSTQTLILYSLVSELPKITEITLNIIVKLEKLDVYSLFVVPGVFTLFAIIGEIFAIKGSTRGSLVFFLTGLILAIYIAVLCNLERMTFNNLCYLSAGCALIFLAGLSSSFRLKKWGFGLLIGGIMGLCIITVILGVTVVI